MNENITCVDSKLYLDRKKIIHVINLCNFLSPKTPYLPLQPQSFGEKVS